MGGVTINTETCVLDSNHNVLPGAFAAGEVVGGIHGGNRIGGNAVADIIILVRLQDIRRLCARKAVRPCVVCRIRAALSGIFPGGAVLAGLHLRTHAMPDDHRVYSYSAVPMGSPILLKLFSHDEALASRVFRLIKQYEDLLTVNRAHSEVMDINHAADSGPSASAVRCSS